MTVIQRNVQDMAHIGISIVYPLCLTRIRVLWLCPQEFCHLILANTFLVDFARVLLYYAKQIKR